MKNILLLTMMLCASTTFATVRTVSNQTPNPGQYTTIQAAINAANAGDTVYVHGSSVYYSNFTLNKQLTIIGTGFLPQSSNPTNAYSIISGGFLTINGTASGSRITGLYFSGASILIQANMHDIIISRCQFDGSGNSGSALEFGADNYNMTISENIFFEGGIGYGISTYTTIGTPHDFLITNNIFRTIGGKAFHYWPVVTNVIVSNNLFYGNGSTNIANGYAQGLTFTNNIFNKVAFAGVSSCTFSNNLTNLCNGNTPWVNNGTDLGVPALGTQNIAATSPNFIYQTNIDAGSYWSSTNFSTYYAVNPGSPTLSSMAGDPDMGPYGGSGSYDFRKASASTLPYVYSLSIGNPTIQSGTNLNINVIGKKHD